MTALSAGAVVELSVLTYSLPVIYVAAFLPGLVGQTVKLCGDVAMQCDVRDWVRVRCSPSGRHQRGFTSAIHHVAAMTVPRRRSHAVLPVIGSVALPAGYRRRPGAAPAAAPIRSQLFATGG